MVLINVVANIYKKLGVTSRSDAVTKALSSGLITFRDLSNLSR